MANKPNKPNKPPAACLTTPLPCPGDIETSVADGREETPESESGGGCGDSSGYETGDGFMNIILLNRISPIS